MSRTTALIHVWNAIRQMAFLALTTFIASVMDLGSPAWAQGGNLQPVQSTLQQLIQVLTGPIATSLAILAVIALGMMAWVGRLTWYFAGSIIFGIVLVFGSTQIVQFFQSAVGR